MLSPSLTEVRTLLEDYDTVPVFYELLSDACTPIQIFSALQEDSGDCFILESVDNASQWGRYSFIGIHPREEISARDGIIRHTDLQTGVCHAVDGKNPLEYLKKFLAGNRAPSFPHYPKMTGGLVGYFGYDTVRYVEKKLCHPPKDDLGIPDLDLLLYEEIIAYDHLSNKTVVIENIRRHQTLSAGEQYLRAEERAKALASRLEEFRPAAKKRGSAHEVEIHCPMSREQYDANLARAKEYIQNGDIFQVVLSRRFEAENPPDPLDVYRVLRSTNPSPYLYYLKRKDYQIVGASPEMLVNVTKGVVSTKPIAGTIARGSTQEQDQANEAALLANPKETAEHMMLVDLGRNDVGRVCKFGSVEVTGLKQVERYSKVMHLVSGVKGMLRDDMTAVDALASLLPAGTLSGAPKVRAMEIIDELESSRRGLYGGTVGYLALDGNIDACIAIRTVLFKDGKAYIQAGGGIVADSIPDQEYAESENKALAVINAIREAARL